MKLRGQMDIRVIDPKGKVKSHVVIENGITDIGFQNMNDLITALATGYPLTHMGIGWGVGSDDAFDPTETDFQGTDQDRVSITPWTQPSEKEFQCVGTWNPTEPIGASFPFTIYEIGIFWGVAPDKMLSRAIRPAGIIRESVDTLEITYKFTMS